MNFSKKRPVANHAMHLTARAGKIWKVSSNLFIIKYLAAQWKPRQQLIGSMVTDMKIEISPFKIDFYDDVFSLWQQCEGVGLSEADSQQNIQAYLIRNPDMSFITRIEGKIVGIILGGHDGRRGYIHHLAVLPNYRRRGIGRQLVERCLSILADSDIKKCHLFIFNENTEGIQFWKRIGWKHRSDISVASKNIEPGA